MFEFVKRRNLWYLVSLLIILPGTIALLLFGGVKLGIDFTGGTVWELQFPRTDMETLRVREVLEQGGAESPFVQIGDGNAANSQSVLIRLRDLREGSPEKARLAEGLRTAFGPYTELRLENVGPSVGESVSRNSVFALLAASVGVMLYLAWAFRKVKRPFMYGACAILGTLYSVLFVFGIFAILGRVANVEVDALFVTSLLTVIGFNVHDTIVTFDRIRENQIRRPAMPFDQVVNYSLNQTVVRSLNTQFTVLATLLALVLFGGETVRVFILSMFLGILSATYSSIFTASQLLVSFNNGDFGRWFRSLRGGRRAGPRPAGAAGD